MVSLSANPAMQALLYDTAVSKSRGLFQDRPYYGDLNGFFLLNSIMV